MKLIVSTTIRQVGAEKKSGYLYTVDLEKQEVIQRSSIAEPPYRKVDLNPRGGMRGSKGIAIYSNKIAITNTSAIFLYDNNWHLIRTISHPSCAGIHDIIFQEDTIWATASRSDMVFQFDFEGELLNSIYLREPNSLRNKINWHPPILLSKEEIFSEKIDFRDPRTHDLETHDNAHINSICELENGVLLVSLGLILKSDFLNLLRLKRWLKDKKLWEKFLALNRKINQRLNFRKKMHSDLVFQPTTGRSAIVRISQDGDIAPLLVLNEKIVPSHSLLPLSENRFVYLDTTEGKVLEINSKTGQVLVSTKITEGFLRGVTQLSKNELVLGSKGELIFFDLEKHIIKKRLQITDVPQESVFDIEILPPNFAIPPIFLGEEIF